MGLIMKENNKEHYEQLKELRPLFDTAKLYRTFVDAIADNKFIVSKCDVQLATQDVCKITKFIQKHHTHISDSKQIFNKTSCLTGFELLDYLLVNIIQGYVFENMYALTATETTV